MKGFLVPGFFAIVLIVIAIAVHAPRCAKNDHSGTRIAGAFLVGGCR